MVTGTRYVFFGGPKTDPPLLHAGEARAFRGGRVRRVPRSVGGGCVRRRRRGRPAGSAGGALGRALLRAARCGKAGKARRGGGRRRVAISAAAAVRLTPRVLRAPAGSGPRSPGGGHRRHRHQLTATPRLVAPTAMTVSAASPTSRRVGAKKSKFREKFQFFIKMFSNF